MKTTLNNLKAMRGMLCAHNQKKIPLLNENVEEGFIDILDGAIHRLEQEFPTAASYPCPFDLDESEEKTKGIIHQIDTLTDAILKLKKRFDKAVVKTDYTNELHEVVRDMCMISERTTDLAQRLNRF